MAGLRKRDLYSSEAAIKFFLIGVLSVALMLFGMSMVYGFAGTTNLTGIADWIAANDAPPLLLASVMLVIVGFGFKVSAVPFHFWAPDTYAGSPMPVAAIPIPASVQSPPPQCGVSPTRPTGRPLTPPVEEATAKTPVASSATAPTVSVADFLCEPVTGAGVIP
ncbi:MAG: proton-conducting transporter membrane subunit [Candidatus Poseidoniia archaeon]